MPQMSPSIICGALALMVLQGQSGPAEAKSHETVAISATVTGNDQGVGFRAMVMKHAIEYNLAGTAKNDADNIVEFTLQGRQKRIDEALETIRSGTHRSSDIMIKTLPIAADPTLNTFTVTDWTSTTRQITTPYTLTFRLRDTGETVSQREAKDIWHGILKTTVKGDDLRKLGDDE